MINKKDLIKIREYLKLLQSVFQEKKIEMLNRENQQQTFQTMSLEFNVATIQFLIDEVDSEIKNNT